MRKKTLFCSISIVCSIAIAGVLSLASISAENRLSIDADTTECSYVFDSSVRPQLLDGEGDSQVSHLRLSYRGATNGPLDYLVTLNDGGAIYTDGTPFSMETLVGSVTNGLKEITVFFNSHNDAKLTLKTAYVSPNDYSNASTFVLTSGVPVSLLPDDNQLLDYLLPRYFYIEASNGSIDVLGLAIKCTMKTRDLFETTTSKTWKGTYEYNNYDTGASNSIDTSIVMNYDSAVEANYITYPTYNEDSMTFGTKKLYFAKFMNPGWLLVENLDKCDYLYEETYITTSLDMTSQFKIASNHSYNVDGFTGNLFVPATSISIAPEDGKYEVNAVGDTLTIVATIAPTYGCTENIEWSLSNDNFVIQSTSGNNNSKLVVKSAVAGGETEVSAKIQGLDEELSAKMTIKTLSQEESIVFPSELVNKTYYFDDSSDSGLTLEMTFSYDGSQYYICPDDDSIFYYGEKCVLTEIKENEKGNLEFTFSDGYSEFVFEYEQNADADILTLLSETNSYYEGSVGYL